MARFITIMMKLLENFQSMTKRLSEEERIERMIPVLQVA